MEDTTEQPSPCIICMHAAHFAHACNMHRRTPFNVSEPFSAFAGLLAAEQRQHALVELADGGNDERQ